MPKDSIGQHCLAISFPARILAIRSPFELEDYIFIIRCSCLNERRSSGEFTNRKTAKVLSHPNSKENSSHSRAGASASPCQPSVLRSLAVDHSGANDTARNVEIAITPFRLATPTQPALLSKRSCSRYVRRLTQLSACEDVLI